MIRRIARALLFVVLACAIVVYAAYRRDIRAARDRVLAGSVILFPALLISAEDDLYKTLPVARLAAGIIPNAKLIAFPTGGHLLLGRGQEVWPAVAAFLRQ